MGIAIILAAGKLKKAYAWREKENISSESSSTCIPNSVGILYVDRTLLQGITAAMPFKYDSNGIYSCVFKIYPPTKHIGSNHALL